MIITIWQVYCEVPGVGKKKTYNLYGIIETRAISSMGFYREKKSLKKNKSPLFFNKITKLVDEGKVFSLMHLVSYKAFNKVLPQDAIQIIV